MGRQLGEIGSQMKNHGCYENRDDALIILSNAMHHVC